MTMSFYPYVYDASREIWDFPPGRPAGSEEMCVEATTANMHDILQALGLTPSSDALPMPIDSFFNLVNGALRGRLGTRSPEIGTHVDEGPGRMTMIHCGRSEGYVERRLHELALFVQRSREIQATHIGWG